MAERDRAPVVEASVESLAQGGEGVAHVELGGVRRAVFVRGAAPGDHLRLAVDTKPRPARGSIVEVLARGPDRVEPGCPYTARCGGCDWMHLAPDAQARGHDAHVAAVLPAAWASTPRRYHRAGEDAWRTRVRLHGRASGGRAVIGLHEARSHEPVEVDRCVALHPLLEQARGRVAPLLEGAHDTFELTLALGGDPARPADERRAVLTVRAARELPPACFGRFEEAVARGEFAGIEVHTEGARRPLRVGDPRPWLVGADGLPLRLPSGGFAQASEGANRVLVARVAELARGALRGRDDTPVLELYAGAGNLTVALAAVSSRVVSVESHEDACAAARENLAARGLSAKVLAGDAALYTWSAAPGLLVLDPPRAGARGLCERLADAARSGRGTRGALPLPRSVLYVSCDPPTLGRDLTLLAGAGYAAVAVELVEMFTHTSHIETVVLLERVRGRG